MVDDDNVAGQQYPVLGRDGWSCSASGLVYLVTCARVECAKQCVISQFIVTIVLYCNMMMQVRG